MRRTEGRQGWRQLRLLISRIPFGRSWSYAAARFRNRLRATVPIMSLRADSRLPSRWTGQCSAPVREHRRFSFFGAERLQLSPKLPPKRTSTLFKRLTGVERSAIHGPLPSQRVASFRITTRPTAVRSRHLWITRASTISSLRKARSSGTGIGIGGSCFRVRISPNGCLIDRLSRPLVVPSDHVALALGSLAGIRSRQTPQGRFGVARDGCSTLGKKAGPSSATRVRTAGPASRSAVDA
jgi:hypothetical protein